MWIMDWTARAACKGTDPDELFVQGAAQNRAKLICRGCPVRTECLADALDNRIEFGVWGGMTERERLQRACRQLTSPGSYPAVSLRFCFMSLTAMTLPCSVTDRLAVQQGYSE